MKALVVRVDDRVGNVLLTTPLVRALLDAGWQVDWLVAARKAAVAGGLGARLRLYDKRDLWRRPWRLFTLLAQLRRAQYDVTIDAAHWHAFSGTSALLSRWSGAARIIGHVRGPWRRFYTDVVVPMGGSEIDEKLRLLTPLGISARTKTLQTKLGADEPSLQRARAVLEAVGIRGAFALVNPGSRKADHRWPAAAFAALAKRLREAHGFEVLVTWGPGEETLAREVAEASGAKKAPFTDLSVLAAILRICQVAITNDTGPMHLAAACGAPTVAVFVGSDAKRWAHAGAFVAIDGDAADAMTKAEAAALGFKKNRTR